MNALAPAADMGPDKLARRALANALTDERRFEEAYRLIRGLVEEDAQEDRVGVLGNVCKETGRLDEAERYYARYRDFARTRGPELQLDAAVQSGRLANALGEPSRALTFFLEARRLAPQCAGPGLPPVEIDRIIARTIAAMTGALITGA